MGGLSLHDGVPTPQIDGTGADLTRSTFTSSSPTLPPVTGAHKRNMTNAAFNAVLKCHFSKIKFLLEHGVSVDVTDDRGQNLLVMALFVDDDEKRDRMFRFLVRRGVDCCARDIMCDRDVLSWACCLGREAQVQMILQTTMGEIDLMRPDGQGNTPLHHATKAGHPQLVRMLVDLMNKYRLSVDVCDNAGLTPYIHARRLGHHLVADILLQEGRASAQQFDTITFRNGDDWEKIGLKERLYLARLERQREFAKYKIKGRVPPLHILPLGPATNDSNVDLHCSKSVRSVNSQSVNGVSRQLYYPGRDVVDGDCDDVSHNSLKPVNTVRRYPASLDLSTHRSSRGGGTTLPALTNKSLDTAFTLWTLTQEGNVSNQPDHFVSSQFDNNKSIEYGGLSGMMAALSDQKTDSYRKVALPPTPTHGKPRTPVEKKKVSTLAILFGRDKQRQRRAAGRGKRSKGQGGCAPPAGKTGKLQAAGSQRRAALLGKNTKAKIHYHQ